MTQKMNIERPFVMNDLIHKGSYIDFFSMIKDLSVTVKMPIAVYIELVVISECVTKSILETIVFSFPLFTLLLSSLFSPLFIYLLTC